MISKIHKETITLLLFFYITVNCLASETPNYKFSKYTSDSISIISIPFCEFGNYGLTYVIDLKNRDTIYKLNNCISPSSLFSNDGNYWVEEHGLSLEFYYQDSLIKFYTKEELDLENENQELVYRTIDGDLLQKDDSEWFAESFIFENFYYGLTINGRLVKINLKNEKLTKPNPTNKLEFEEYKTLKNKAEPNVVSIDENYDTPLNTKVTFKSKPLEDTLKQYLENITNEPTYVGLSVAFNNCNAEIIDFNIYDYDIKLFTRKKKIEHTSIRSQLIYDYTNYFFSKIDTLKCDFSIDNWAVSYTMPINK